MAKSLAKTPAPAKDRIYGSKVNPKGSASSEKSAKNIQLSAKTIIALSNKLKEFKETHKTDKVSLNDLKAVYRRGLGAYSKTHRPTITGGVPNSRNAWAMARVNAFLRKAGGGEYKKAYVQDDDLLKMHLGGDMSKHLAPNGKPSKLSHEQWHLVRTPEFKEWFGDWGFIYKENNPDTRLKDGGYLSSIEESILNLKTNGIVLRSGGVTLICYNTGNHKRHSSLYNLNLIYKVLSNIDKELASKIIVDFNNGNYDQFDEDKIDEYKKSKNLIIINQNEVLYDSSNPDIRYDDGGEIYKFIEDGIVELKMYDTTNEHSKIYGFDAQKPLYIQSINVSKEHRNKGIGTKVMNFIVEHAKNNGNDLIIGHITQKAEPNIDVIKSMIVKSGFNTCEGNNDFYKIISSNDSKYEKGGEVEEHKETYKKWKSLVNMSYSELDKFYNSKEGKEAGLSSSEANAQGISSGRESARMIMKMKKTPVSKWTDTMWKWANKQISFISRMSGMKGDLYDDKGNKTRKHTSLLIWGHNPKKYNAGGETSTDKKYNDGVIYHEKNGNFFVRKNTIYYWLYDIDDAGDKLNNGEYDFVMFPPATLSMAMQKGFVPPLQLIWTKKYQNKTKGSEHLIGIIQAYYLEKDKKLYIEMMTSHPKMRGQGIMSHMVKELRDEFGLSQDDLIFVDTTKDGKDLKRQSITKREVIFMKN